MIYSDIFSHLVFLVLRVSGTGNFPPPLSNSDEREYFRRYKEDGDLDARSKLIEHNLRLVAHIVKKYSNAQNQDDLISIGTIGLIKAVDSFDPKLGAKFATYAGKCLQNEILMYFRSEKKLAAEVSLSETIDLDKDGNPLTYEDIIAVEDTIADDIDLKLKSARAVEIIQNDLDKRERKIMVLRYGLSGKEPLTQREVAQRLGISRSYVSRIEGGALDKIAAGLKRRQM